MAVGHVDDLLGPLAVEDLPRLHAGLRQLGVLRDGLARVLGGDVLAGHVLVHEALALHVQLQEAVDAKRSAHVVGHRRVGAQLHPAAGPDAHELAAAVIDAAHELLGPRRVVVAHLGVRAVVAAAQHHGLGVHLQVAVGRLRVRAHNLVVLHDQLLALGIVDQLGAAGHGCVERCFARPLHVRVRGNGAVEVGVDFFLVVVGFQRREALRADEVRLVRLAVGRGGFQHFVVGALDEPVEILARVVVPVVHHPGVAATARLLDELVEDVLFRSPLDAQVLLDLGSHDAEVAGHGDDRVAVFRLLFQHDDLLAGFGGFLRRGGAGDAHADDQHVAVLLLLDVGGNRRGREEVGGVFGGGDARRAAAVRAAVALGGCGAGALLRSAAGQAGGSSGNGCGGSQAQECATTQSGFFHVPLSFR